jgi:hypothetical protein
MDLIGCLQVSNAFRIHGGRVVPNNPFITHDFLSKFQPPIKRPLAKFIILITFRELISLNLTINLKVE